MREDLVPQAGLEVALDLREVVVGPEPELEQARPAAHDVHREVEQGCRDHLAVDEHVLLDEVPPARAGDDGGELVPKLVALAVRSRELDRPVERVAQVDLALDHVVPAWGVGVLEVGQPDPGARVEGVDRHLAVGRTGDLDPAVDQAGRRRRHVPVGLAHLARLGEEVREHAAVDLGLALGAPCEQRGTTRAETALQIGQEPERLVAEDLLVAFADGADDLHAGRSPELGHHLSDHTRFPQCGISIPQWRHCK